MRAPAVTDLLADPRTVAVDIDGLAEFVAGAGVGLAVLTGTPGRRPASHDLAVVVREFLRDPRRELRVAVVEDAWNAEAKARWGVRIEPSLMIVRDGVVLEVVAGIREWSVYAERVGRLLERAA
jgi:hydrogenase-1 operon protein HyaE